MFVSSLFIFIYFMYIHILCHFHVSSEMNYMDIYGLFLFVCHLAVLFKCKLLNAKYTCTRVSMEVIVTSKFKLG